MELFWYVACHLFFKLTANLIKIGLIFLQIHSHFMTSTIYQQSTCLDLLISVHVSIQINKEVFTCPGMLKRKTLILDLDETLIHSHHDGVLRQTVKPGTPPDFVLKVCHFCHGWPTGL